MAGHWTEVKTLKPGGRWAHSMAYDPMRERIVLFGGNAEPQVDLNETWEWDGKAWTLVASFGPSPRSSVNSVYIPDRGSILIFGGERTENTNTKTIPKVFADPWEWNGKGWKELPDFGPAPRRLSALAYDTARKRLVLFGGSDRPYFSTPKNPKDDIAEPDPRTWEWDGRGWSVCATNGPRPRYGHSMVFDPVRNRVVLFGGGYDELTKDKKPQRITRYLGDTWEWDGQSWTQVSDIGPSPRTMHSMAYDCDRGRIILYAGEISMDPDKTMMENIPNHTWEWDGNGWMQVANSGPGNWVLTGLAYDQARKQTVLFGGVGQGVGSSVWIWNP
jgi:hypothetical protein